MSYDIKLPQLLPAPPELLLGRDREISRVTRSLAHARVVVLGGMPGVGKTALMSALAQRLRLEDGYSILWASPSEGGDVLDELDQNLRSHGVTTFSPYLERQEMSPEERLLTLTGLLQHGRFLVCIDDIHALGAREAAQLAAHLSQHLGPSRALLGTRLRLPLDPGEPLDLINIELGGLPEESSVQLVRRLLKESPDSSSPVSDETLLSLARKADGHPLCLRLAASLLASGAAAPEELEEHFERARRGHVRDLLSKALDELPGDQRRLLYTLAVFRRPATRRALAALTGDDDIHAPSRGLRHRYLAERDSSGNLRLHVLVKEYCLERMPSEERQRLALALGTYHERAAREQPEHSLPHLMDAHAYLLEASEDGRAYHILLEIMEDLLVRARYRELLPMVDRALASIYEPDPRVLLIKARALRDLGRPQEARAVLVDVARSASTAASRADAQSELGRLEQSLGRHDKALKLYYAALETRRSLDDAAGEADLLSLIATVFKDQGDYTRAIKLYTQALSTHQELDLEGSQAFDLHNLGKIHYYQGRHDEALASHRKALELWTRRGDQLSAALARNGIANVQRDRGKIPEAEALYRENLGLYRVLANPFGQAYTLVNLGELSRERGDVMEAEALLRTALQLSRDIGNRLGEALTLDKLGDVHRARGEYAKARDIYRNSLTLKRRLRSPYGLGITLNNLGDLERETGQYADALACYEESLDICRRHHDQVGIARALDGKAVILSDRGEDRKAQELFESALAIRRDLEARSGIGRSLSHLGGAARGSGDVEKAMALYQEGLDIFRALQNRQEIQRTLGCLAQLYAHLANYDEAGRYAWESLEVARTLKDVKGQAVALTQIGQISYFKGDLNEASNHLSDALALRERIGDPRGIVSTLEPLALVRLGEGDSSDADRLLTQALAYCEGHGYPRMALSIHCHRVLIALREGQVDRARRRIASLRHEAARIGSGETTAYLERLAGYACLRAGEEEGAEAHLRTARDIYRKLRNAREGQRLEAELAALDKDGLLDSIERRRSLSAHSRNLEEEVLQSHGTDAAILVATVLSPRAIVSAGDGQEDKRPLEWGRALARIFESGGGQASRPVAGRMTYRFPSVPAALEAARRAMAMARQKGLPRPRVGINRGRFLALGQAFLGEPVDLAARYHGLASPGEVVVGEAAYLPLNEPRPGAVELPSQRLRGSDRTVRCWLVEV